MAAYTSMSSRLRLEKLHPKARRVVEAVVKEQDNSLLSSYRPNDEQDGLYAKGRTEPGSIVTNAKGGESIHNVWLVDDEGEGAIAFDLRPFPLDSDPDRAKVQYALLAGRVLQEAAVQRVPMTWGNDWDRDGIPVASDPDEQFEDLGHFHMVRDKP